jgi:hypothetical protein
MVSGVEEGGGLKSGDWSSSVEGGYHSEQQGSRDHVSKARAQAKHIAAAVRAICRTEFATHIDRHLLQYHIC